MNPPISITGISSISPIGASLAESWKGYQNKSHCFTIKHNELVASLPPNIRDDIQDLRHSDSKYKALDDTVLFAIYTSRMAVQNAHWNSSDRYGINISSSRGATELFEVHYKEFLNSNKVSPLGSPNTTLGNISSWVAHDLQTRGPEISHSITCSSALHAILNGIAWIRSGMCQKFLVGGSEAPLTAFTIAQMQALKIYNKNKTEEYPCRPLDLEKTTNSMILSEGASMACLESGTSKNALAHIIGIGYATELLEHNVAISTDAICFQRSMNMALKNIKPLDIDVIITHTPGTIKGDLAEYNAIKKVFGKDHPALTNNKWKLGHTLSVSGMLNIEMAILMMQQQRFIPIPFIKHEIPKEINKIMINAVGFGGNAVSIILSKP